MMDFNASRLKGKYKVITDVVVDVYDTERNDLKVATWAPLYGLKEIEDLPANENKAELAEICLKAYIEFYSPYILEN